MATTMTPNEYAIARGWDFSCIEATAGHGVSDDDIEGLRAAGITAEEMLAWCCAQVADSLTVIESNGDSADPMCCSSPMRGEWRA